MRPTTYSLSCTLTSVAALGLLMAGCGAHKSIATAGEAYPVTPATSLAHAGTDDADDGAGGEAYDRIAENQFQNAQQSPLSTFSIDVDTAAYSNVRRFLNQGKLPPRDAVRIEELINYFDYRYPQPIGDAPFSIISEVGPSPWNADHKLVHIGLQGRRVDMSEMPPRNLVFLLDVSGSMSASNKLPLLKDALGLLVDQMDERDRVAIVVYAGASGMVLPPTPGTRKPDILSALGRLNAGGSTNGGAGIQLAYQLAEQNFDPNAINRVILATDGDFNVGTTSRSALIELIEAKRKSGVYLTVLGLGMGNLKDSTMEQLADKGNGNYAYLDSIAEARKVLVTEAGGTLLTIAKDVKIQVAFNADRVASYRLVGYENRVMANQDFDDDSKDAGEIGAGHNVTAIYEVKLTDDAAPADEMLTVRLRYKLPDSDTSIPTQVPVRAGDAALDATSDAFRFSAAVAGFGMLLRDSDNKGAATFDMIAQLAQGALGADPEGYRKEFLSLISTARQLGQPAAAPTRAY